jgi:hypothetical protein
MITKSATAATMPTPNERLQISARSLVHPKTVMRCYKGLPVRETVALRVTKAARELHLMEPSIVLAGGAK